MEENRKKKVISYFNYAAKQYTISVLETRSKHTPPLTKQRDFNRRIVVKYFSNIIKVPFWPSFKDMGLWLYMFFVFLVFVLEQVLSCMEGKTILLLWEIRFTLFLSLLVNHPQQFTKKKLRNTSFQRLKIRG